MIDGNWDRQGRPITLEARVALCHAEVDGVPYKQVARTKVSEANATVSTVWLGDDWSHGGAVPIIFETLVSGGQLDMDGQRWATEEEARAGHDEYVRRVREAALKLREFAARPEVAAAVLAVDVALKTYREVVGGQDLSWGANSDYERLLTAVRATAEAAP